MTHRLNGPHTNVFCETCKQEKEMYYVPWCSVCEKPEYEPMPTLNVIKALRHIEVLAGDEPTKDAMYLDGYKSRMWKYFIKYVDFRNDTYVLFWRPEIDLDDPDEVLTKQEQKDVTLFCDTFNIGEHGVLLHFSW